MIPLNAIRTINPFDKYREVGILMFAEYPTTIILIDKEKNPVIKEWVDCDDDKNVDRYFFYHSTPKLLKLFLDGTLSHRDLIHNAKDGIVYFQDISGKKEESYVMALSKIPPSYLPEMDFFFDKNDAVELDKILGGFNFDDLKEEKVEMMEQIRNIALQDKTEAFNLHFHDSPGVGYGIIDSNILGEMIIRADNLYKDLALDHYLGKNRGEQKSKSKKIRDLEPFIKTQVFKNLAASYSIVLKPKAAKYNVFTPATDNETIVQKLFSLVNNSQSDENLKEEYILHSEITVKSFKSFVNEIYKAELNVEMNFFSSSTKTGITTELNYKKANDILNAIERLSIEGEEKFLKKGKFRALNLNTGHYNFVSLDGDSFSGHIDDSIREGSEQIKFINIYEVSIERRSLKAAGKSEPKIMDKIVAFYEQKED